MNSNYIYLSLFIGLFAIAGIYLLFVLMNKFYKIREERITKNVIKYFDEKQRGER